MNVYDSDRIADLLETIQYYVTDSLHEADLIIFNTCHIREKAVEKVYSDIGRLHSINNYALVGLVGCVAQAEAEEIFRRAPRIRLVCGPQSYHLLTKMVRHALAFPESHLLEVDFSSKEKFESFTFGKRKRFSDFVSIQEGCDKFCTYCVVPYTRGAEFSRPVDDIIREVQIGVQNGVKEIILLGQNVNAYKYMNITLAKLIEKLHRLDGLQRIRYMTSHPADMLNDLINAHGSFPKLMPFLHLPVQSGSDKILKSMNRKHTSDDYRRIVDQIRVKKPDIAFSSDFIVGFPGESDEDFKQTLKLVHDVGFASSYSFKFSPRPGTPAYHYSHKIPTDVMNVRLNTLQNVLHDHQKFFNTSFIGKKLDVLIEKKGRYDKQWVGRSVYMQPVHLESADDLFGKIITVNITRIEGFSLFGQKIDS